MQLNAKFLPVREAVSISETGHAQSLHRMKITILILQFPLASEAKQPLFPPFLLYPLSLAKRNSFEFREAISYISLLLFNPFRVVVHSLNLHPWVSPTATHI